MCSFQPPLAMRFQIQAHEQAKTESETQQTASHNMLETQVNSHFNIIVIFLSV